MDTSDPDITFDEKGICNHCNDFEHRLKPHWMPNELGKKKLDELVAKIKEDTKNERYNCIIGLSGGVDSSYLAYVAKKKLGLNPLAVHVDAGWNSDEAVSNIENLTKRLEIDLHTIVINWEEMKGLQLAFFKANVPNQDIPQDHAFFAGLYNYATKFNIKYVLNGSNLATESILPTSWGYNAMDSKHILDINQRFGSEPLRTFPLVSFFKYYIYYPHIKKMTVIKPLNYMHYNKDEAIKFMQDELGWKYYGGKHYESRFTKFFQSYYLPVKFGFDKRRAHLSSLIVSGQMSRDEALKELEKLSYNPNTIENDMTFVAKKLGISLEDFKDIISRPNKAHSDYGSNDSLVKVSKKIKSALSKLKRLFFK